MFTTILHYLHRQITPLFPPGLATCLAASYLSDGKFLKPFWNEFAGTLVMIGLTFSPGKWIGVDSLYLAWAAHAAGVVLADYLCGGPHVNPAVSVSMWALGKCSYTEAYVRSAGAMAGGLVAFPLFQKFANRLEWVELGGPEFDPAEDEDGSASGFSEFLAMILLMILIYTVNWELDFGKYHYWIKQTLTAVGIRYLIETFPRAGPAMNPMLGTTWYIFRYGGYPDQLGHYFTYWVSTCAGAVVASFLYVVYAGGTLFGSKLPIGPVKEELKANEAEKPKEKESKKKK